MSAKVKMKYILRIVRNSYSRTSNSLLYESFLIVYGSSIDI